MEVLRQWWEWDAAAEDTSLVLHVRPLLRDSSPLTHHRSPPLLLPTLKAFIVLTNCKAE